MITFAGHLKATKQQRTLRFSGDLGAKALASKNNQYRESFEPNKHQWFLVQYLSKQYKTETHQEKARQEPQQLIEDKAAPFDISSPSVQCGRHCFLSLCLRERAAEIQCFMVCI